MKFESLKTTGCCGLVLVAGRCEIHHEGFLFDKGGEALVV